MQKSDEINTIYAELIKLVGEENMLIIYESFKGQQINFPQRLYKPEYVKKYVAEHSSANTREMAKKFKYSERWIQQLKNSKTC